MVDKHLSFAIKIKNTQSLLFTNKSALWPNAAQGVSITKAVEKKMILKSYFNTNC